jgi:serine/threonine protein kinase
VGQLLHNELIPELPFALKAKMAYQASKGMHFLHSSGTAPLLFISRTFPLALTRSEPLSGIVHRDLKSLNLLLDSKWNVKVRSIAVGSRASHTHTPTHTDFAVVSV